MPNIAWVLFDLEEHKIYNTMLHLLWNMNYHFSFALGKLSSWKTILIFFLLLFLPFCLIFMCVSFFAGCLKFLCHACHLYHLYHPIFLCHLQVPYNLCLGAVQSDVGRGQLHKPARRRQTFDVQNLHHPANTCTPNNNTNTKCRYKYILGQGDIT